MSEPQQRIKKLVSGKRWPLQWDFKVWWYKCERKSKNKINHHESPRKLGGLAKAKECLWDGGRRGCQGRLGLLFRILDSSDKESRENQASLHRHLTWDWLTDWSRSVVSQLFATPWTVANQAPPSMGFSRQEYWSGLPFPSPIPMKHMLKMVGFIIYFLPQ